MCLTIHQRNAHCTQVPGGHCRKKMPRKKSKLQDGRDRNLSPGYNQETDIGRPPDRQDSETATNELKKRVEYAKYATVRSQETERKVKYMFFTSK